MALYGDKFGKSLPLCQGVCLGQLVGIAVGNTDISGLALLHHIVQPLHDIVERALIVPHVVDVQIHIVHAQIFQALVYHLLDMGLGCDAGLHLLGRAGQELGGHHHLIPLCEILQRPAQVLLTGAALVGDGRVIEIDARLQTFFDDLSCVLLIDGPGVLSLSGVSKAHAPHADAGDIQIRVSQSCILHFHPSIDFTYILT